MTLDEFFTGHDRSRQLFDALCRAVRGKERYELRVTKSQVAFVRAHPFAWAWVPGRYLKDHHAPLVLSITFDHRDASPRWKQVVETSPGRFMHHLEIRDESEIDPEVHEWMREAWESGT